jgi:hypothetical protein
MPPVTDLSDGSANGALKLYALVLSVSVSAKVYRGAAPWYVHIQGLASSGSPGFTQHVTPSLNPLTSLMAVLIRSSRAGLPRAVSLMAANPWHLSEACRVEAG